MEMRLSQDKKGHTFCRLLSFLLWNRRKSRPYDLQLPSFSSSYLLGFLMEDKRSRSYADGGMQIEPYGAWGPPMSYSASYASSYSQKEMKLKKVKSGTSFKGGWFNDPEFQRRKRISGYKVYSVEGKVKGSLRNSIRWLKDKYYRVVYGWW